MRHCATDEPDDSLVIFDSNFGRPGFLAVRRTDQIFLTNSLPGNCRISRFISNPSSATDTVEGGRPLARMISSMDFSSSESVS